MGFSDQKPRFTSLSETAYNRLRTMIETGELSPRSPLREVHLAQSLEMSRTPVREALRRLEAEGFVDNLPRLGLMVAVLDRHRVIELYEFLEVLECTAARNTAMHATPAEIETLEQYIRQEEKVLEDPAALSALNAKFHDVLYRGARNHYLLKAVHTVRDAIFLLGKSTLATSGRGPRAHVEHLLIVEAIKNRDPEAAYKAMQAHVQSTKRVRLRMVDGEESA
ncbi:MAG TPA: GntR family transcriptional regulator [Bordetella sp.]